MVHFIMPPNGQMQRKVTHFSAIRNNFANFYLFCAKMRFGSSHIPSCCSSNAAPQHEPWLRQQEVFRIFASCFL